jgi:hypothetical protein
MNRLCFLVIDKGGQGEDTEELRSCNLMQVKVTSLFGSCPFSFDGQDLLVDIERQFLGFPSRDGELNIKPLLGSMSSVRAPFMSSTVGMWSTPT